MRWNSVYRLCRSILENRRALAIILQENESIPLFDDHDWQLLSSVVSVLEPIYWATTEIENRRCSIASFVPIAKTIIKCLETKSVSTCLPLNSFRKTIANGLKKRLAEAEWEEYYTLTKNGLISQPGIKRNR